MSNNTFQRQGDPVATGFSIGRAPLRLRGIRFAEGDGGAPPAAPPAPPAAHAAPSPAAVAAMLEHLGKATPPAPPAAPPAAPAQPLVQGFTPEQVQKLMSDADAATKTAADAQAALTAMQAERDAAQAQLAEHARTNAVTTAANGKANAALLLDSTKFQAAIKDLELTDATALTAAVDQFVKDNPAYAATPAAPTLPSTSGGTPAGGSTDKPKTLEGAIAAHFAG